MRSRWTLWLMSAIVMLLGAGASEAACRAGGEYRVTGPNSTGSLSLTETVVDGQSSSGTASLTLVSKQACPVCLIAVLVYPGQYQAAPGSDDTCFLAVTVRDPFKTQSDRTGAVGGTLAFGGSVILFGSHDSFFLEHAADLNLTLGIRSDGLLKP